MSVSNRLLPWYLRLRLFAFFGQIFILTLALHVFELTLPWRLILLILTAVPVTNLLAHALKNISLSETTKIGSLLIFDTAVLTLVLSNSGGATNPFSIVYLLHVVLAAVMLTPAWTWALAFLTSVCFGMLFIVSKAVPEWEHHGMHHGFSLHLHGMLFSYVLVAFLVAYFVGRISEALKSKEREIQRLENIEQNQQKLMSLTALSADAAHQLGTPLGTIALVAHEMEKFFKESINPDLIEDIELLKSETQRCKRILSELAERTGDVRGEMPSWFSKDVLIQEIKDGMNFDTLPNLEVNSDLKEFYLPKRALVIALKSLVKNALEASASGAKVQINVFISKGLLNFEIADQGIGIKTDILNRVGEPFYSTKPEGKGIGLGIYVTRLIAQQLEGELTINSVPEVGTRVLFSIPYNVTKINQKAA